MTTEQQQVKEFMLAFGQDCPTKPVIPSLEIRKFRAKLIMEEALETVRSLGLEAINKHEGIHYIYPYSFEFIENQLYKPNLEEISDGLADLHYVGYCGTGLACGLDMEKLFTEVHNSNMSKFWTSDELEIYDLPPGATVSDTNLNETCVVRDRDGKVIKPPSFNKPYFKDLLEAQKLI